jgi:uncharacterized flavoprotein (TIGR03862 family)
MNTGYYPNTKQVRVAVIGGGPAGLMAAEVAAENGASVCIFEAQRALGRKFLVAGKSGLNLSHQASPASFAQQYTGKDLPETAWRQRLESFTTKNICDWAKKLGIETFNSQGGKIFPVGKKAAPLLKRWIEKLKSLSIGVHVNHRWIDFLPKRDTYQLEFEHAGASISLEVDAIIFAMGGAAWPQTGSDGNWVNCFQKKAIPLEPFAAANCGWQCTWKPETLACAEGQPLHHLKVCAGGRCEAGELMVTRYGLEGTPIYRLGPMLRNMDNVSIEINFKPVFTRQQILRKMESVRKHWYQEAQTRLKLSPAMCAIIRQFMPEIQDHASCLEAIQHCVIPLQSPRPIAEAISTAGGVAWPALNQDFQIQAFPNVYVAGEMMDWEAPSGGYLIHAAMMTGAIAGAAAAAKN